MMARQSQKRPGNYDYCIIIVLLLLLVNIILSYFLFLSSFLSFFFLCLFEADAISIFP